MVLGKQTKSMLTHFYRVSSSFQVHMALLVKGIHVPVTVNHNAKLLVIFPLWLAIGWLNIKDIVYCIFPCISHQSTLSIELLKVSRFLEYFPCQFKVLCVRRCPVILVSESIVIKN